MHALPLCALLLFIHWFICCLFFLFLFSRFYHMCFIFLSCVFSVYGLLLKKTRIWQHLHFWSCYFFVSFFFRKQKIACLCTLAFLSFFFEKKVSFLKSHVFLNTNLFCSLCSISVFPLFLFLFFKILINLITLFLFLSFCILKKTW